jgi:DNA-binding SARP family transcriptional activator
VAFVALQERTVRRRYVSGALWLDVTEERANANLRSALWRTPAPGGCPLLLASSTHIWFNPDVEIDFRASVARALAVARVSEPSVGRAEGMTLDIPRLADDLLPDWDEVTIQVP